MATIYSIKEKANKISTIIESLENENLSLIDRDILLQNIRDLYTEIYELGNQAPTVVNEPKTEETAPINEEKEPVQEPQEIDIPIEIDLDDEEDISTVEDILMQEAEETEKQEAEKVQEIEEEIKDIEIPEETEVNNDVEEELDKEIEIYEEVVKEIQAEPEILTNEVAEPVIEPARQMTLGEQLGQNRQSSLNDILASNKEATDISTKMNQQPISDIKSAISIGERFMYIKELFKGDGTMFDSTIARLNEMASYDEAVGFVVARFGWNLTDETAANFMNIVKRKFL